MSWPNAHPQPYGYPQPYGHQQPGPYPHHPYPPSAQPYPPAAQHDPRAGQPYLPVAQPYPPPPQPPVAGHAPWPAHYPPQGSHPTHPATGDQRLFQVRIRKHTGAIILMFNQTYTITGTFAQCEAALRNALLHNLLAGWWSIASVLIWNWVAILDNHSARKHLHRQAAQAYIAETAAWRQPPAPPNPTTNT